MLLLYVFPHISAQYVRYGKNREQYNINNADRFNKCLILYKIPTVFDNFDLTNDMWSFHVNLSSMITPKNCVARTLVIILLFIDIHTLSILSDTHLYSRVNWASWREREYPNYETVIKGIRTRALSIASPASLRMHPYETYANESSRVDEILPVPS